jgi:hypothetical protein
MQNFTFDATSVTYLPPAGGVASTALASAVEVLAKCLPVSAFPEKLIIAVNSRARCDLALSTIFVTSPEDVPQVTHELTHLCLARLADETWAQGDGSLKVRECLPRAAELLATGQVPSGLAEPVAENEELAQQWNGLATRTETGARKLDAWLTANVSAQTHGEGASANGKSDDLVLMNCGTARGVLALRSLARMRSLDPTPLDDDSTRAILRRWGDTDSLTQIGPLRDLLGSRSGGEVDEPTALSMLLHAWRRHEPHAFVSDANAPTPPPPIACGLFELAWQEFGRPTPTLIHPTTAARGPAPAPGPFLLPPTGTRTTILGQKIQTYLRNGLEQDAWRRRSAAAVWACAAAIKAEPNTHDSEDALVPPASTAFVVLGSEHAAWTRALDSLKNQLPPIGRPRLVSTPADLKAALSNPPSVGDGVCEVILVLSKSPRQGDIDACRGHATFNSKPLRGLLFPPPTDDILARSPRRPQFEPPRQYFEATWFTAERETNSLPRNVFDATASGEPTTPLSWLLAFTRWGHAEAVLA